MTESEFNKILDDLLEKLRIIGREFSWDKAYVSEVLSTILGEIYVAGRPMANGLKSYISFREVDEKLVEDLSSWEANYASKAGGAKTSNSNEMAIMYSYVHLTLKAHHRFGIRVGSLGDAPLNSAEYCLWCLTPTALGGAGLRGYVEMGATESGSRLGAGVGNLNRYTIRESRFEEPVDNVMNYTLDTVSDLDFLRDCTQLHVVGPRIKTQRVNQKVRQNLPKYVRNPELLEILAEEKGATPRTMEFVKRLRSFKEVDAQEVKNYYDATACSQLDNLVTKICSADTAKKLLSLREVRALRMQVRNDAVRCSAAFRYRLYGLPIDYSVLPAFREVTSE